MKKTILSAAILVCTTLCAINNASATTCIAPETIAIESAGYMGASTYSGTLATIYVDATKNEFTVSIPKPQERLTACMPGTFRLVDKGSHYEVTGWLDDIGLLNKPSGSRAYFEVGSSQSSGQVIVYQVVLIAK